VVRCLPIPLHEISSDVLIDGNRFLGDLGLASPDVLVDNGSGHIDLQV
jgi:hypothetical protein